MDDVRVICGVCKEEIAPDDKEFVWVCEVCLRQICAFCGNSCACGRILCDDCFKAHQLVCRESSKISK